MLSKLGGDIDGCNKALQVDLPCSSTIVHYARRDVRADLLMSSDVVEALIHTVIW